MLLPSPSLRVAAAVAFASIIFSRASADQTLSGSQFYDLVGSPHQDGPPSWALDTDSINITRQNLPQAQTNGRSTLGSLDAPTYDRFAPLRKRQTTAPWGSRTCADTNPYLNPPDTGTIRSYTFNIARGQLSPDGVQKSMMLINGQYPGPTIEANWGDTISVTVNNNLDNEGTSMHWHGLLQNGTVGMDGVPGVSQCPIAPGTSFTYSFKATSYGSTWYHAHYSAQYTAGLFGAILIHGPTDNAPYDIDLGPVLLHDHYYDDYYTSVQNVMGTDLGKVAFNSDNNLINGKGNANCAFAGGRPCTPNAGLARFTFTPGKIHRLRLINTGAEAIQKFSIDYHQLTVMAIDFVPITPYTTTVLTLAVGQRADVLVLAGGKPTDSTWMRSTVSACSKASQPNALAMIYYAQADTTLIPSTTPWPDTTEPCAEETLSVARPFYPISPPSNPEKTISVDITVGLNATNHLLWSINNSTFRTDYNTPILPLYQAPQLPSPSTIKPEWNIYDTLSASSVRLIINNKSPASHPMHLHGYDMYILSAGGLGLSQVASNPSGTVSWDGNTIVHPENPVRRDTFMLQPGGYMVVQIDSKNPGIWPLHCHIAWHVSGGLFMNLGTQTPAINSLPQADAKVCQAWQTWSGRGVDQIDSGL